ncbi:MAG: ATP-binding protein [Anaerolineae bacterium]|nr:ATP-binding protein [Thermoflexales bacterium]MDW8395306.1 ATP-binding protein [Anaerolineae bacterium]
MPIRLRLTLWYSGVLTLVLLFYGVSVYFAANTFLIQQVDTRLEQAADAVIPLVASQRPETVQKGNRRVITFPRLDAFRASEVYVQIIAPSGEVVGVSPNIFDTSFDALLDPQAIQIAATTPVTQIRELRSNVQHTGAPPLRVLTRPLIAREDRLVGYLQVGTSLESVNTAQRILLLTLLALGAVSVAFSALVGVLLASRALRPVDQITQTAMAIYRAENLNQRVVEPKTNDEVARLSRAFNEMLDRLSQLFRAQQRLIADVSHELRTPLTVIRGNVDLMRMFGQLDPESLDAITREAERMNRMVADLLLLSQADAGVLPMNFTTVNVPALVADVERSGQMLAKGRVRIIAQAEPGLTLYADPDRLKQVLLNLVDNAIKHTPDGGEVRIEASGNYNGFARLTVSDTGIGIPEKDLPHIFERFYRVDKSRSRASGGSGLGLSIVSTIVQAHHGRIAVSSKEGVGTTFDVYLPMQTPLQAAQLDSQAA